MKYIHKNSLMGCLGLLCAAYANNVQAQQKLPTERVMIDNAKEMYSISLSDKALYYAGDNKQEASSNSDIKLTLTNIGKTKDAGKYSVSIDDLHASLKSPDANGNMMKMDTFIHPAQMGISNTVIWIGRDGKFQKINRKNDLLLSSIIPQMGVILKCLTLTLPTIKANKGAKWEENRIDTLQQGMNKLITETPLQFTYVGTIDTLGSSLGVIQFTSKAFFIKLEDEMMRNLSVTYHLKGDGKLSGRCLIDLKTGHVVAFTQQSDISYTLSIKSGNKPEETFPVQTSESIKGYRQ
jgi:hypothetical protein